MSGNRKKITINPNFFKLSNTKTNNKKSRNKSKVINNDNTQKFIKPNDVKKSLIKKVREYQQNNKQNNNDTNNNNDEDKNYDDFVSEFDKSIKYLEELKNKNNNKIKHKTLKNKNKNNTNTININTESIDINYNNNDLFENNEPKFGILKGGKKPLYSHYKKTLKNKNKHNNNVKIDISNDGFDKKSNDNHNNIRKNKLDNIIKHNKKKKSKVKRYRRKLYLGKNTLKNKIGVLVKSRKNRKRIRNEVKVLDKKPINEVKEYLRKHNLIKIGTTAPDYLLRSMYKSSYLSGDIYNKNSDILLHNYVNE